MKRLLVAFLLVAMAPAPAIADDAGVIRGFVASALDGSPAAGVCVQAATTDFAVQTQATTATDGTYRLAGLSPGDYQVFFWDCERPVPIYVAEYFDDAAGAEDATPVAVGPGQDVIIDATLSVLGSLSGTVTNSIGDMPLNNVCVETEPGGFVGVTGPDGTYSFSLPPNTYDLTFLECGPSQYAPQPGPELTIGQGEAIAGIDAALELGGMIVGRVVDDATGFGVGGVSVQIPGGVPPYYPDRAVETGRDGFYSIGGLPAGTYLLRFVDPGSRYVADRYDPNGDGAADPISVALGEQQILEDTALARGANVRGTVTDETTGVPVPDLCADLFDASQRLVASGYTGMDGRFNVGRLAAGTYRLRVGPCDGIDARGYGAAWFGGSDFATATPIPLTAGAVVAGLHLTVFRDAGNVSGLVSGAITVDPFLCASVFDLDGGFVRAGWVNADGRYNVGLVPEGSYRVLFGPCPGDPVDFGGVPIWHGGSLSAEAAAVVRVTNGRTTVGIGAVVPAFEPFDPGATIALTEPATGRWHLIDGAGGGRSFYYGVPGDLPVLGDWDCDGVETPGMFRPDDGFVYLRNTNTVGEADTEFFLGLAEDVPIAGDWDGDGCDSLGVYRPSEGRVYLRNSLTTGVADVSYLFGDPGDRPFAGDIDGDGVDEVGLFRESSGFVYFRLTHTSGFADAEFFYGIPGDRIFAGDWDGDGLDTIATYRQTSAAVYLRNDNSLGPADLTLALGMTGAVPAS